MQSTSATSICVCFVTPSPLQLCAAPVMPAMLSFSRPRLPRADPHSRHGGTAWCSLITPCCSAHLSHALDLTHAPAMPAVFTLPHHISRMHPHVSVTPPTPPHTLQVHHEAVDTGASRYFNWVGERGMRGPPKRETGAGQNQRMPQGTHLGSLNPPSPDESKERNTCSMPSPVSCAHAFAFRLGRQRQQQGQAHLIWFLAALVAD